MTVSGQPRAPRRGQCLADLDIIIKLNAVKNLRDHTLNFKAFTQNARKLNLAGIQEIILMIINN